MKKLLYSFIAALGIFGTFSCSDMLEVDSDAMAINPELNQKTDSVFYALGIAQAMQELADQYFFIGEMRGELSATTNATDNNLRELANFTATASNKYDSAYHYYKVINNCNYYLAHRDTSLLTGSNNVTHDEYVAVEAIRAWAYMQLGRTYEKVPFFTEPITTISQVNASHYPMYTISEIASALIPNLERYTGTPVPTLNYYLANIGRPNWSSSDKSVYTPRLFMPVDVVLGDLYLERGEGDDYIRAARHYFEYFNNTRDVIRTTTAYDYQTAVHFSRTDNSFTAPADWGDNNSYVTENWSLMFTSLNSGSRQSDILTFIPMAVSSLRGKTSAVPAAFGYDYYSTESSGSCPKFNDVQIVPSYDYYALTDSSEYYYFDGSLVDGLWGVSHAKLGDGRASYTSGTERRAMEIFQVDELDTAKIYTAKCYQNNIIVYRFTTVWMHLAEALNRAGYPDAAFAILRNGISDYLDNLIDEPTVSVDPETGEDVYTYYPYKYLSRRSYDMLCNEVPFLNPANKDQYPAAQGFGIHQRGASSQKLKTQTMTFSTTGSRNYAVSEQTNTHYIPKVIIGEKMQEIANKLNVAVGTTLQDSINAMEDVLCDEYAKEFAFEGTRFYDLVRMARHKNASGYNGGAFGDAWLSHKLRNKAANVTTKNCYLPFK